MHRRLNRIRDWLHRKSVDKRARLHRSGKSKRTHIETVIRKFTKEEFRHYCQTEAKKHMGAWRPKGVVIHNTDVPRLSDWPRVDAQQRLRNLQSYYEGLGWNGTPHLFIAPEGIYTLNPLWKRGTHSPSFNASYYGVELVGNMDIEAFPATEKDNATYAIACLYELMGIRPVVGTVPKPGVFAGNLFYHRDDNRTTHKACPGKNIGTKQDWVGGVSRVLAGMGAKMADAAPNAPAEQMTTLMSPGVTLTEEATPAFIAASGIDPFSDTAGSEAPCDHCDELKVSGEEVVETLPAPAKPWYESRAQIAGIVGALAVIAGTVGYRMNSDQVETWTSALVVLLPLAVSGITHLVQMWGRWRANAPIQGGPADPAIIAQMARFDESRREIRGHE